MPDDSFHGPFVALACICQTTLQEASGHLSLIRVTDRVGVLGTAPQMQPHPLQNLTLVVGLKSGTLRETHRIKIQPITPTGSRLPAVETSVLFEGDDRGPGIILPLSIVLTEEGLYWFEISLEEQVLTRIPLRVIYQRAQGMPFPNQPPASR
jgi:hypothetical protein